MLRASLVLFITVSVPLADCLSFGQRGGNSIGGTFSEHLTEHQKDKIEQLQQYTFANFVAKFRRMYQPESDEWREREAIFNKNLNDLLDHARKATTWSSGITKFMDYKDEEFKKMLGHKGGKHAKAGLQQSLLQTFDDVELPDEVDHRAKMVQTKHFHRDQGACGSCWALAAVHALEGHLELKSGNGVALSSQQVVSCTPNPRHCGGTGGCQGATAELGYEYIQKNGIVADANWPYTSFGGSDGACLEEKSANMKHVTIDSFVQLPENKMKPLLHALYTEGPAVVSVDGSPWAMYSDGIFSGCAPDSIINHAVVALGYGEERKLLDTNGETEQVHKYWLLKNSWGRDWGEAGHIRLKRHDDEEEYCGTDNKPEEGTACEGGPAYVRVCGMCGILYDSAYPTGVRLAEGISKAPAQESLLATSVQEDKPEVPEGMVAVLMPTEDHSGIKPEVYEAMMNSLMHPEE